MVNMLDVQGGPFDRLLSLKEAADIWGVDESVLRRAISSGKFVEGRDCRKFGKQWVVTVDAMARERKWKGGFSPWSQHLTELRKAERASRESGET